MTNSNNFNLNSVVTLKNGSDSEGDGDDYKPRPDRDLKQKRVFGIKTSNTVEDDS